MNSRYELVIYWSQDDDCFVVEVPELPGCMSDGKTYQEAVSNAEAVIAEWIETARALGRSIPEPKGNYPGFFDEAFPALRESWLVSKEGERLSYRTYEDSLNPPILHRKELLLLGDHPRRPEFEALTSAAESIGLFDAPRRIGLPRAGKTSSGLWTARWSVSANARITPEPTAGGRVRHEGFKRSGLTGVGNYANIKKNREREE